MRIASSLFLLLSSAVLLATPAAEAGDALEGRSYYFGTHEARTTITFVSEADLETIHGITNKIWGRIDVDKKGTSASGTIRAGVGGLRTGIALRDEHLRSDAWLDAKKHPYIRLHLVKAVENEDGKTWSYEADLEIKGVKKRYKGSARVVAIPDRIGKQLGAGSWVRVRTNFEVKLSDHGITVPQKLGAKVSETWKIGVEIYGTTVNPHARSGKEQ